MDDQEPHGISAVLNPSEDLDSAVLDLAAVLGGLVGDSFEILLVAKHPQSSVADVLARAPALPLRVVEGESIADGCAAARFELILVAARDGQFDVRELNRLLDAIQAGADVVAGYRPRRTDAIVRTFQRWGLKVEVDYAFKLLRRQVVQHLGDRDLLTACLAELAAKGYRVRELPVSHRKPRFGQAVAA